VTVESLPNFAMLYGHNIGVIHNSIILTVEAQSRYINTLIGAVLQARASGKSLRVVHSGPCRGFHQEAPNPPQRFVVSSPKLH
jgi:hypothetical protein